MENGAGGESFEGGVFDDEPFYYQHTTSGILSMSNRGANSNGSQFFITLDKTPWLDSHHVVFGRVIAGMPTVKAIEGVGSESGRPKKKVVITKCYETF